MPLDIGLVERDFIATRFYFPGGKMKIKPSLYLMLMFFVPNFSFGDCLGEVQLISKTGQVVAKASSCVVFPSTSVPIFHETNPLCPGLTIDDILATGITVPLNDKGLCPYELGAPLTGYVSLQEDGTLIIQ